MINIKNKIGKILNVLLIKKDAIILKNIFKFKSSKINTKSYYNIEIRFPKSNWL